MPSQAECLPGESGGIGSEGRADAGCVEIAPGAAKFSAKEELSIGRFCHAITGEAPEVRMFREALACSAWGKSACVHGISDGMEMGSVGNPSSKQALSRVSWLGMGRSRLDEGKCERLVQCRRLDLKRVRNKGLPEETRTGEFLLHLGNGLQLHTSSTKVGVPERVLVWNYLRALAADWEGIRGSKDGVYAPEHPEFEYFQSMSALILARLEFLSQTLLYLILEEDLSWQVVWRYMMLFVEQYFVGVQFEAHSELDGRMLKAWCDSKNRVVRSRVLAMESVKLVVLEKARSLAGDLRGVMDAAGRRLQEIGRKAVRDRKAGSESCVGKQDRKTGSERSDRKAGSESRIGKQCRIGKQGSAMQDRKAVQERRAVRRAVRRGERRVARKARGGEVLELAVSSAAGGGESLGGGRFWPTTRALP
jgi:hypothetical protein